MSIGEFPNLSGEIGRGAVAHAKHSRSKRSWVENFAGSSYGNFTP